jgi:pimeloyl-ACP methyl ester carboxylesterase
LRGGFGYYRAIFEDIAQNRAHAAKRLAMKVLAIGGAGGLGGLMEQMMRGVADDVTGMVIEDCGHYLPEEAPGAVTERLLAFLG